MRESILLNAYEFLSLKGFEVKTFSNNCFDLIARKENNSFIIKVLSNIDSFRAEQANELLKLSDLFNAVPLIIGEKSKAFDLKNSVVYERHGINVITMNSFTELIQENYPLTKSFKGRDSVELDYVKLRNARKNLNLSYRELAEKMNSSIESIYRYEHGANASVDAAKKLEEILNERLIKEIDVLKKPKTEISFESETNDESLQKVSDLGIKMSLFHHSPFKAVTKSKILIQKGTGKKDLIKKAGELSKTKHLLSDNSMILTKEFSQKSIYSVPVIEEEELESLSKKKDLIELIKERQKK
ncbi:MAG: helix-turn-helix domain-containing protein [Candidatus Diapherotrites archaeon]|nr:helix-turn-helix domain-containing protein [Candidatus Diapherotrites archaeon]